MGSVVYALISWLCINAGNILELLTSFTVFSFFIVCIRDFCLSSNVKPMQKESLCKNIKLILQLVLGFLALIFALFLFFITWNTIFFYFYIFLIMSLLVTGILIKKHVPFLLFMVFILFSALIFFVETTYKSNVVIQGTSNTCTLSNAWNLTLQYNKSFFNTYGKPLPKPRLFYIYKFFRFPIGGPIANYTRDFAEKLAATSRTGACEDFALGLTRLLRDSLHCQTRIVGVLGDQVDHALPEVKINDTWYILDIIFTTPKHPVKACDYATYLLENRRDIYQKIRIITDYDTNEDLRIEHGFINKG